MARTFSSLSEFLTPDYDTIIDVRAPSEYAEDRIPGAISLPVLSDAERARVGTIYTQEAPFKARKIGAALVARNAAAHIEGPLADKSGGWRPLVYCWRGGQRSGSFASILSQIGWRVELVDGGYRSYRRAVKTLLYDTPLASRVVLLDGNTGTAKTDVLAALRDRGVQVIDLEGLARHRGSILGGWGAEAQPSQKGFESQLAAEVARLDPARPVVIEAESSKIGGLIVPPALWHAMRPAPRLAIAAPVPARVRYLLDAYADLIARPDRLALLIEALKPLQGAERVARWQGLIAVKDFAMLAEELIVHHYDPRYGRQRQGGGETGKTQILETPDLHPDDIGRLADRIAEALPRI
ncbi:tRNA 2-selenouridine(34) synthase MnmH [Mesobaculum littorinae]|uniref:tRNA 2-selenouridine(34) synthase MnmH n=1 Tax=Mesobaculum littorinae TaxID=2486419 RepID=A0A438ALS9_9RHOB|nr:tRNA 2-selenouridine(34) synthase MnmH [Mesobaculum littorinae]RVV99565.1 tRNA 2-selenouridine(34) synthase MnmH [Mesobaculum littorinae]